MTANTETVMVIDADASATVPPPASSQPLSTTPDPSQLQTASPLSLSEPAPSSRPSPRSQTPSPSPPSKASSSTFSLNWLGSQYTTNLNGLLAFAFAAVIAIPSLHYARYSAQLAEHAEKRAREAEHRADMLAIWTARKDFREQCLSVEVSDKPSIRGRPLTSSYFLGRKTKKPGV